MARKSLGAPSSGASDILTRGEFLSKGNGLALATFCDVRINGSAQYQSLSANSFQRLQLKTVATDTGFNFDTSNYWYNCPVTGLYHIVGAVRPSDNTGAGVQVGAGVYTTEADGNWFYWNLDAAVNSGTQRATFLYERLSFQNKGDQLRQFAYTNATTQIVSANLQIYCIAAS